MTKLAVVAGVDGSVPAETLSSGIAPTPAGGAATLQAAKIVSTLARTSQ
jgi:hypothetical protein